MRLFALRGATTAEANTPEAILGATEELMGEILARNSLAVGDVVSCIFTVTDDLDADFPAAAARRAGFSAVPLLCAREIPVPGALDRVIRVMVHYHAGHEHVPNHIYLHGARVLRADLDANCSRSPVPGVPVTATLAAPRAS